MWEEEKLKLPPISSWTELLDAALPLTLAGWCWHQPIMLVVIARWRLLFADWTALKSKLDAGSTAWQCRRKRRRWVRKLYNAREFEVLFGWWCTAERLHSTVHSTAHSKQAVTFGIITLAWPLNPTVPPSIMGKTVHNFRAFGISGSSPWQRQPRQ